MLYLTGQNAKSWPALVQILSQDQDLDIVVTLYSEHSPDELPAAFSADDSVEELEHITTYDDDDEKPPYSVRRTVEDTVLQDFNENIAKLEACCDNFALYGPGEREWFACVIPHEEMALVKDDRLLAKLKAAGLNVTEKKPEWW